MNEILRFLPKILYTWKLLERKKSNKSVIIFKFGLEKHIRFWYNMSTMRKSRQLARQCVSFYPVPTEGAESVKKRFFSILIVAALLLCLVPALSISAKAASSFEASPELIQLIKKWEGFSPKPYWDYGQWTVGYGTSCSGEDLARYQAEGISEEEAEEALRKHIENYSKSVNSFIDKYGMTVNQAQFDAMVSLTYNAGPGWMFRTCTIRTAYAEGWTGDDFVFALTEWSNAGGTILNGLVRRRLSEANMYLNGVYDTTPDANLSYVKFNGNGGDPSNDIQGYIVSEEPAVRATATYENYVFQGWYTDPSGGEKVEKLDAGVKGYTLYAHWAAGDGEDMPQDSTEVVITGTPVSYTREVASKTLNAFQQPVKGALVVDSFYQYDLLDIVAEYTDTSGVKWGKVENIGWVNLTYTQEPVEIDESNGVAVTVTADLVNIRRGPGTTYTRVGSANTGDVLIITHTTTGGGYTWGRSSKGWIALKYTNYDDVINGTAGDGNDTEEPANPGTGSGSTESTEPTTPTEPETKPTTVMGTVKVNNFMYIRKDAGTSNPVVGTLSGGTRVEILEQKAAGGTIWGRIDKGWISLSYVVLDSADSGNDSGNQNTPETPVVTTVTGKVKVNSGRLNIRSGPSTGYSVVGSYGNGDSVTITEQKTVGKTIWGKTTHGWISLDYVVLDKAQEPEKVPEETIPEETVPEETEPEQTEPEETVPEETEPEETVPEVTVPEETVPEETVPEETIPEETVPEETVPEETKPVEKPDDSTTTTIETGTVVLKSGSLNVRNGAGTNCAIVGYYLNGAKVTITERKTVGGTVWGKVEKGWISLNYVRIDSAATETARTGTVNVDDFLRIRSGAGTSYPCIGYYYKNNKVTITETKVVYGVTWGKTDKGWISLDYVIFDQGSTDKPVQTPAEDKKEETGMTGVVTGSDLRIRNGAGTNHGIVGVLQKGHKVTILETKVVNGMKWGRISIGWICMDYVKLD